MKKSKGFTLAELLIVVAIIAVLVAISIPVFTSQLERSREAADLANARSAYSEAVTTYMQTGAAAEVQVQATQRTAGWDYVSGQIGAQMSGATGSGIMYISGVCSPAYIGISVDDAGNVTISPVGAAK